MVLLEILRTLPLLSAAVWLSLALFQVYRERVHTWTETFFLSACFFAGFYGVSDWLFFNAGSDESARIAASAALVAVALATMFLFLFTLVYIGRMKRPYFSVIAIALIVIVIVLVFGFAGFNTPDTPDELYVPIFNPVPFVIFVAYILAFGVASIVNLYRLHRIVREHSERLARRTRGLLVVFTLVFVLGLSTNGYLGVSQNTTIPPPFSTLLIVVAAATVYTLYPGTGQRISETIRRFQARRYDIKAVFLIFEDGTLIASRVKSGEKIVDTDLFSATLDVIQNFMRTSFPGLRGKWLRTIAHGDHTIVMERGRYAYLTVLLEGEEADQLRRQMRDLLLEFESKNREVLAKWRGLPSDAVGADEALTVLLEEDPDRIQR